MYKCRFSEHGNPGGIASIYSGSVTSQTQTDRIIYRPPLEDSSGQRFGFMRTFYTDSRWLNDADFVASFDVGDEFVYFFFREPAVESANCGKAVYSRVARICKNDVGGDVILQQTFATFVKARLNCSIPAEYPFYFDLIRKLKSGKILCGRT